MNTIDPRSFDNLRRSALLTVLTLLGSVWAMAQVAAAPPKDGNASLPAYPLKLSANRRYLVDQNNTPFLITGDNPHALLGMGSTADAETYFADRQTHGFNAVWMNILVASVSLKLEMGCTSRLEPNQCPGAAACPAVSTK